MSYNPDPEWAPVDDSVLYTIACPVMWFTK